MNTYHEQLDWLYSQIPNYQKHGDEAYKPGLQRITELTEAFGNPQTNFKSIHIAGTNGKGSSSHMLASILQEEGYTVGLFTSPHLINFTERFRINGKEVSEKEVSEIIKEVQNKKFTSEFSFFEISTLIAFQLFAIHNVDFAVIETGLGGRLDSTNIVVPILSMITSISRDHTQLLGDTIEEIAFEKAGIIKEKVPVVLGKMPESAEKVMIDRAQSNHSKIYFSRNIRKTYPSDLNGAYQIENQKTVLAGIQAMNEEGYTVSEHSVQQGLLHIRKNTGLKARWEVIQEKPKVIWDTAHNEAGIELAFTEIKKEKYNKVYVILGFVKGKNVSEIIDLLPIENFEYVFVQPSNSRGLSPYEYESLLSSLSYKIVPSVADAYNQVVALAKEDDLVVVMGSNFVIADLMNSQWGGK